MIFLIDNKVERQGSYHWDKSSLEKYKDYIIPFYSYDEIIAYGREKVFAEKNIILFHDSFFTDEKNKHIEEEPGKILDNLFKRAQDKKNKIVFFSGATQATVINEFDASLSVSRLYENLGDFIDGYQKFGSDIDLGIIGYGLNYKAEEHLEALQVIWDDMFRLEDFKRIKIDAIPSISEDLIKLYGLEREREYSSIELKALFKKK